MSLSADLEVEGSSTGEPNENKAEFVYGSSDRAKCILVSMCIGLLSNETHGRVLGDPSVESYSSSKQRRSFAPKKADLVKEVNRRLGSDITLQQERRPRAQNWSNSQLVEWLDTHPITNEKDIRFSGRKNKLFRIWQ